ncbi:hypothetical protein ABZ897_49005 [Nonomuraea sp. NPDC046802]|uniref:hypothetical protein n=1 Tax=Nonomuraea sp. NPDC046802 TaxID=3154919 RepID=UPI0033CB4D8F
MSSQKIRNVIAVAALIAGVSWLTASPAAAAPCHNGEPSLLTSTSIASYCSDEARLHLNDGSPASSRMVAEESNKLAQAAGHMARQMGLTGLATARSALGTSDLGGVAAMWGMPALTSASPAFFPALPGPVTMKDVATMAGVPALPALPTLPSVPQEPLGGLVRSDVPGGRASYHNTIAGSGIESPMDLEKPVRQVGSDVINVLLPKAVESVEGTSMLTGDSALGGFTELVQKLGLR